MQPRFLEAERGSEQAHHLPVALAFAQRSDGLMIVGQQRGAIAPCAESVCSSCDVAGSTMSA